jgi:hypothetical protein
VIEEKKEKKRRKGREESRCIKIHARHPSLSKGKRRSIPI